MLLDTRRDLQAMAGEEVDLLVIGGGIIGCGVARDAAGRGLSVALVEKEDFSHGTTARSTRLIHGGLRYLELYDFPLVHEALREREILLRTAPHLVHPLPFVTPIYAGDRWSPPMVKVGMLLYDFLSLGKSMPSHRMLSPAQVREMEPGLKEAGLRGGSLYYDAQVDFPERLCIENLLSAQVRGARFANYALARSLTLSAGRVCGAQVEDRSAGEIHSLRARVVVNAAGPWADEVVHLAAPQAPARLRRTRGIHLVVPAFTHHAVVLLAQRDGRVFFAVPWNGLTLVGTTDTDFEESPDAVDAPRAEVEYLVEETRRVFPEADVGRVLYTMAGVRPLARSCRGPASAVSRRHRVVDHEAEGLPGLVSVFGSKITTYRSIAEEVGDVVARRLGCRARSHTEGEPLYGGAAKPDACRPAVRAGAAALGLDAAQADHLVALYGTRAEDVLSLAEGEPRLRERVASAYPDILAQVVYAVRTEMARTPADVLLRRTSIGFAPGRGQDALPAVAGELASLLGRSVTSDQ